MKRNNSSVAIVLSLLILGTLVIGCQQGRQAKIWAPTITTHQSPLPKFWERKEIYLNRDNQPMMVTIDGKLMILGSESADEPHRLIALDGHTGTTIWQYGDTSNKSLTVSSSMVFVGEVGRVVALNPATGDLIWSTQLPAQSVTKLLLRDNILYVDTNDKYFLLDRETGEILQSIDYSIDSAPNPDIPMWSDAKMDLEYVDQMAYFQKLISWPNVKEVEISATDENSGTQLWSATVQIVGRAAVSSLGIFALDADGTLIKLDPLSGLKSDLMQFTPEPTKRYQYEDGTFREYGYQLAVDAEHQLLFVYLGDSAQLFAFRIGDN